ncbi:MAG: DUF4112 domain-containing protein [Lewinellaceae bacterium]|nr:DUF4112 domain-containing protein [Phaeodactylibacter sp.]MCB0615838.1 DUF4112 domain-containing protein [Phaeodactylibacter sp.]MCB9350340.1 DUF4112 domain-containing protein [Lewinellaceae bacterium]
MENPPTRTIYQQELAWIDSAASFLDNRFRIPGTNIRFGVDFLIGLVPYIGDVVSFAISGLLVMVMARKGASGMALVKMVGNVWVDGAIGAIPLLGDLFDLRYRANLRNLQLLKEHYAEGKHQGSAWPVVFLILLSLFALIALSVWVVWKALYWIFS